MLKPPGLNPVDYLIVGHITRDITPVGVHIGGSAAYAGLTARALGQQVGIVTSFGEKDELPGFEEISIANLPCQDSTVFENRYTPKGRQQVLHSRAASLDFYHIPEVWRHARIVHLAPVAGEVQPAMVRNFPDSFVYLTIQGWLRQWDSNGLVSLAEWPEAAFILRQVDAAVLSEEDVLGDQQIINAFAEAAQVLVVTQGEKGADVYYEGNFHHIPAPRVNEVDLTGAGDIFAAAFFISLSENRDPLTAAGFAVQIASDSVTRSGLAGVPTADAIIKISTEV